MGFPLSLVSWRHFVAVALYVWASYHQYTCHWILARLRMAPGQKSNQNLDSSKDSKQRNPKDTSESELNLGLGIPEGDWFQYVSCPHYFAEMLVYCSLLLVQWRGAAMVFPCVFVVCVLTLNARQMHSWYCSNFPDYPTNRKRIVPYVF